MCTYLEEVLSEDADRSVIKNHEGRASNIADTQIYQCENYQQSAHISKVKYLGYAFYHYKGKCRFRVHPKSMIKMKDKIRELTKRKPMNG